LENLPYAEWPQLCAGTGVYSGIGYIPNMKRQCIIALIAAGGLSGLSLMAAAATGANPYTPIITRNVFALVPIPTGPPPSLVPVVPPPKITPTGIMTLFGKLQVIFKVEGVAHPGQPPKTESFLLSEGDRQDDIEVQKIDKENSKVTFNNHGEVQELPLAVGVASSGALPSPPGLTPTPSMTPPGMVPGMVPGVAPGGGPVLGGRFGRARNVPGVGTPVTSSPDMGVAPGFGGGTAAPANADAAPPKLTPEQQIINMESQRAKWLDEGNPAAAIIPPTALTDQVIGNGAGGDAPAPPMPGN
jgi:hypothetical protein